MRTGAKVTAGLAISTACLCAIAVASGHTRPLNGEYAISTINVDPGPNDPVDSHLIIYLRGESAQSLYKAMKVAPKNSDAWRGPGVQIKTIGGTSCSYTAKDEAYSCSFAVDIARQQVEALAC